MMMIRYIYKVSEKELSGVSNAEDMTRRATIPREGDDRREDRRGAVQTGGDGR
jgi:hypothetical protein